MMSEWNVFLLKLCWDIIGSELRYRKFSILVCVLKSNQSPGWPTFQMWSALFSRTAYRPTDSYHQKRASHYSASKPTTHCCAHHWGGEHMDIPSVGDPLCGSWLFCSFLIGWARRWVGKTELGQATEFHVLDTYTGELVGQYQLVPLELDI